MGRRRAPVGPCDRRLEALALWLDEQRQRSGLSYEDLVRKTSYSESTLRRATRGQTVPAQNVVLAYAAACGADALTAEKLWLAARRRAGRASGARPIMLMPELVRSFPQIHSVMAAYRLRAGEPSLRDMNRRARGKLPPSTMSRVVRGEAHPSRSHFLAFMSACDVPDAALSAWGEAWDRASQGTQHHQPASARLGPPAVPAPPAHAWTPRHRAQEAATVLRVVLGERLRTLRETAGLTRHEAARALRVAPATIRRMEEAEVALKIPYLQVLLSTYGVAEAEVEAFLNLSDQANTPDWWQRFHDLVSAWFNPFLILEGQARVIYGFEPHCVPGLLQTPDYARAIIRSSRLSPDTRSVERLVDLRMERQRRLVGENPPRLWMVMDESVLRRHVGSAAVMRAQLDWLIETSSLPHVYLQIIPFDAGPHAGAYGPFSIFRFAQPHLPDIVYEENLIGATYVDTWRDTARYREAMDTLSVQASTSSRTREMLTEARRCL
jgi:transcriptional regulator with XRE-family HTH domain